MGFYVFLGTCFQFKRQDKNLIVLSCRFLPRIIDNNKSGWYIILEKYNFEWLSFDILMRIIATRQTAPRRLKGILEIDCMMDGPENELKTLRRK